MNRVMLDIFLIVFMSLDIFMGMVDHQVSVSLGATANRYHYK